MSIPRLFRACLSALLLIGAPQLTGDEIRELVLTASAATNVQNLTPQETRRLFLGIPVEKNGMTLRPLLNATDTLLYEVFLQRVTFMSATAYEQQVRALVFRLGGQRPEVFEDRAQLLDALSTHPNWVSFDWSSGLAQEPRLKAIGTLWKGAIN